MSPAKRRPRTSGSDGGRRLRAAIRALVRRFAISERADVACCGMTVAQAATLETLASEGPMRLGELGARLGIAPSTLTRNLLRLEERGLVRRAPEKEDGRAARAALTGAGERAAAEVARQDDAFAENILARLPDRKRRAVLDGLDELLGAVRDATESCCPGAFDHLMSGIPRGGTAASRRAS
jgi:DNA-binding MarR family transcriptional regulator